MRKVIKKKNMGQIILNILFVFMCCLVITPLLLVISVSLSSESDIAKYGYEFIPRNLDLAAYKFILDNPTEIVNAYKVTIAFSTVGTVVTTLFTAMFAYPLSRQGLRGRLGVSFYLYFTMLFGGGLVPTYILNTNYLHLNDTFWIYIIPSMLSSWNVFMIRTFFAGLPNEIFESMRIDGANEYNIFFKTVLPLSKPVLATVALTTFLGLWGNWNTSMLYINKKELISLQYLLQRMLQNLELVRELASSSGTAGVSVDVDIPSETVRMAMAMVVAGPTLVIFPFFQKYFVKGLTVGSVKG